MVVPLHRCKSAFVMKSYLEVGAFQDPLGKNWSETGFNLARPIKALSFFPQLPRPYLRRI
jgi:hypothetical protein